MKRFIPLLTLAGLACLGWIRPAAAECSQLTDDQLAELIAEGEVAFKNYQVQLNFAGGVIEIDPDWQNGRLLTTASVSNAGRNGINVAGCFNSVGTINLQFVAPPAAGATIDGITYYATNIAGIGFRLAYVTPAGTFFDLPRSLTFRQDTNPFWARWATGSQFEIQLVKIGDLQVGSGTVAFSAPLQVGTADDGRIVTTINANNVTIRVLPSCTVDSSTIDVDFDTFGPEDFPNGTEGPTRPVAFNVVCSGPTPPQSITATLGAIADTVDPTLIQNSQGSATNLAIRLREPSSNIVLAPNDPNSQLVHAPGGAMQNRFQLDSTVMRVGSAAPTPGTIQATATINLTFM